MDLGASVTARMAQRQWAELVPTELFRALSSTCVPYDTRAISSCDHYGHLRHEPPTDRLNLQHRPRTTSRITITITSRGVLMTRAGMAHGMWRRIWHVRGAPRARHLCTNTRVGAPRDACAARVRHKCRRRQSVKRGSGVNVGGADMVCAGIFWRGVGRARGSARARTRGSVHNVD